MAKKKTYVNTALTRLVQDKDIVDPVKAAVLDFSLNTDIRTSLEGVTLASQILSYTKNSYGNTIKSNKNWLANNYAYGLPTADIISTNDLDLNDDVEAFHISKKPALKTIAIDGYRNVFPTTTGKSFISDPDLFHLALQILQDEFLVMSKADTYVKVPDYLNSFLNGSSSDPITELLVPDYCPTESAIKNKIVRVSKVEIIFAQETIDNLIGSNKTDSYVSKVFYSTFKDDPKNRSTPMLYKGMLEKKYVIANNAYVYEERNIRDYSVDPNALVDSFDITFEVIEDFQTRSYYKVKRFFSEYEISGTPEEEETTPGLNLNFEENKKDPTLLHVFDNGYFSTYNYETGSNPALLSAFKKEARLGSYIPNIYFRLYNDDLTADRYKETNEYKSSIKYCKRLGLNWLSLAKELQEASQNVKDLTNLYITHSVPLMSKSETAKEQKENQDVLEYVYGYLEQLYKVAPEYEPTKVLPKFAKTNAREFAQNAVKGGSRIVIKDKAFEQILSFDAIGYKDVEGNIHDYGGYYRTVASSQTANIAAYGGFNHPRGSTWVKGYTPPDGQLYDAYNLTDDAKYRDPALKAKVGDFMAGSMTMTNYFDAENSVIKIGSFTTTKYFIRMQISDTHYREYCLYNGANTYNVKGGYTTTFSALDDDFMLPIDLGFIQNKGAKNVNVLVLKSAHVVISTFTVIKEKWYQTGIFKAVLFVIAVVLAIPTGGQSITVAVVVTAVVQVIALQLVIQLVAKFLVNTLKIDAGVVFAVVAVVALIFGGYALGVKPGTAFGFTSQQFMALASNAFSISNYSFQLQTQNMLKEHNKNADLLGKKQEELDKLREDLKLDVVRHPLYLMSDVITKAQVIVGESPSLFYIRTTSVDAGLAAFQLTDKYVDSAVRLPTFMETYQKMLIG